VRASHVVRVLGVFALLQGSYELYELVVGLAVGLLGLAGLRLCSRGLGVADNQLSLIVSDQLGILVNFSPGCAKNNFADV
jgi:hypothetical protein